MSFRAQIFIVFLFFEVLCARGEKVVLRIRTANRFTDKPEKVHVRSNLPFGITTNDIISLGGLKLGYDVGTDLYYVHGEVTLAPKEIRTFEVELKDIWQIPVEKIETLRKRTELLAKQLENTEFSTTAAQLKVEILKRIDEIIVRQKEYAIKPGMKVLPHITAYEQNLDVLKRIRFDIGAMENLVLGAGKDPGSLIGEVLNAPKPATDVAIPSEQYGTVIFRVVYRNPSTTDKLKTNIRRELPPEVKSEDVLDGGGLEVATDTKTARTYLYKDSVELLPGQSVRFDAKIRDKWNINLPLIRMVRTNCMDVLAKVEAIGGYKSLEEDLRNIQSELDAVEKDHGPETFGPEYIYFHRRQSERIRTLAEQVANISARLQPKKPTRLGIPGKPPTPKTTWMIIYIILGFLLVLSLLFFLRWYGRSKPERFDQA